MGLFVVLCGFPHKNQRGLELKIILSIENDEEPIMAEALRLSPVICTYPDDKYENLEIEVIQYFTNWIRKSSSFIPISKYFSVKCLKS